MDRIHGSIEGVTDSAVQGWIANFDHPERLEHVVCWSVDGASLRFQASFARPDVSVALAKPGRFGFAIPTTCLRELGREIRLTSVDGVPLGNGDPIMLPPDAGVAEDDGPTWMLLHIQKTAGTSLRTALGRAMPAAAAAYVYDDGTSGISAQELGQLPSAQRGQLRLVMGHLYFGLHSYLRRPVAYATVLREPRARLRSHYHHHVTCRTSYPFCGATLATRLVVQHGLTDEFDNLMTRMIAGTAPQFLPIGYVTEALVDVALRNIRERFRFVCLTERMDEHFPALCAAMGLPAPELPRENTDRVTQSCALDDAVDWDEVMHRNRFDAMLYTRVQSERLCGRDLAH